MPPLFKELVQKQLPPLFYKDIKILVWNPNF